MFGVCVYAFINIVTFKNYYYYKKGYDYFCVCKYPSLMQLFLSMNGGYKKCLDFMCMLF